MSQLLHATARGEALPVAHLGAVPATKKTYATDASVEKCDALALELPIFAPRTAHFSPGLRTARDLAGRVRQIQAWQRGMY